MTRTVFFINQLFLNLEKKKTFFKEFFSFALFTLFFGFLIGNIFGTFLNTIRSFIFWDGLIIFIILFIMESLNFFLYKKRNRFFTVFQKISYSDRVRRKKQSLICYCGLKKKQNIFIWKSLNFLKIGIMFGFFIDAFKVGS